MKTQSLILLVALFSFVFIQPSCDKVEELKDSVWKFSTVTSTGAINSIEQSSTDDNPTGTISFFVTNKGVTAFEFKAFQIPYASAKNFDWVRSGDVYTLTFKDGDVQTWKVLSEDATTMKMEWVDELLNVGGMASVTATFTVTLTK